SRQERVCIFHSYHAPFLFFFFISDYETLKLTGVGISVVMFAVGIGLVISKCLTTLSSQWMGGPCICELTSQAPKTSRPLLLSEV
uniref:FXYD domain-containing ion transport regulator n=1 Tax=Cyclopterus lumpus TaxID=8103 RepID=A0A8C2WHT3_CYCLU